MTKLEKWTVAVLICVIFFFLGKQQQELRFLREDIKNLELVQTNMIELERGFSNGLSNVVVAILKQDDWNKKLAEKIRELDGREWTVMTNR